MKQLEMVGVRDGLTALIHGLRALQFTTHPVLAFLIPTRRCNLDCSYCDEFDLTSQPVALKEMQQRIRRLARLGTSIVFVSGGEPMLHPDLPKIIRSIGRHLMIPGLITNGYLLNERRIEALNRAGLKFLQISIDNVEPDAVSKKSLRLLNPKLKLLQRHARFEVNINAVLGSGVVNPADALIIQDRAHELGFSFSLGLIHDVQGAIKPLGEAELAVFRAVKQRAKADADLLSHEFQNALAAGEPVEWRCRAGGRYLYVDENGIVSRCSQQRGTPGIPLGQYTLKDIRREYLTVKPCAPFCTVGCVHEVSEVDAWRDPQVEVPEVRRVWPTVLWEWSVKFGARLFLDPPR